MAGIPENPDFGQGQTLGEYVELNVGGAILSHDDEVVKVPLEGELPSIPTNDHPRSEYRKQVFTNLHRFGEEIVIVVPINPRRDEEMQIYWVAERQEWVGMFHSSAAPLDQGSFFRGPYALDDFYTLRILGAFGLDPRGVVPIMEDFFSLSRVLHMESDSLEKMVRQTNRFFEPVEY